MFQSGVYRKSPVWIQELLLSSRGWVRSSLRERGSFKRELADVLETQWLDEQRLHELQLLRLRRTLEHAGKHVPFYRERFKTAGFEPADLKSLSDLKCLPLMRKQDVFDSGKSMVSEVHVGPKFEARTSGTTGLQVATLRDLHSINRENAFVWRQMMWAGLKLGDRRAWIRGDKIVPQEQTQAPFWRHNRGEKLLMMSAFHLSESRAESYLQALEAFDPVVFMAYPSAVLLLAHYLVENGRRYKGRSLRGMVTSSETISEEQRRLVRQAFGVEMFDWYGASERMSAIGTCDHGNYHLMADYSYTELLPMAQGGCEVVGTTFDNDLMPLIRYQLGDEVRPADSAQRCTCGRSFPLITSLVGRIDDYVLLPDGRKLNMLSGILDYIPHLLEGQVRQDSASELTLVLALAPGAPCDQDAVRRTVHSFIGDALAVKFQFVDSVPRTSNGKLRLVVRTI